MKQQAAHWLFDLGNSRFKCAPLGDEGCGAVQILDHPAEFNLPQGQIAWVASVADPAKTTEFVQQLQHRFQQVKCVRPRVHCLELNLAAAPETFGVDRFLALLAVAELKKSCLVVGIGTALTIDLIDHTGQHYGGRIAPSPDTMRQLLAQRAVQLPASGGQYVEWANNTADALASGCLGTALALIERSYVQAEQQLGCRPDLILHGGGTPALKPLLPDATYRPALVLEGLARWVRPPIPI